METGKALHDRLTKICQGVCAVHHAEDAAEEARRHPEPAHSPKPVTVTRPTPIHLPQHKR